MKKRIFTILFAGMSLASSGQYFPFPTEDACWEGSFIGIIGTPLKEYFVICGDTTFNDGLTYNKIYQVSLDAEGNVANQVFVSAIAEEPDQKLIWANNGYGGAYLLYDFNLNEGDKFPVNSEDTLKVDSIGFIAVGGEMRRTIFFEHNPEFPQEFWIEGIGSNFNLLTRGISLEIIVDYTPYLECFHQNNEVKINLFPESSECHPGFHTSIGCSISTGNQNPPEPGLAFEMYPNPAAAIVYLVAEGIHKNSLEVKILDTFGKQVMVHLSDTFPAEIQLDKLAPGIYFCGIFDPESGRCTNFKKLVVQR